MINPFNYFSLYDISVNRRGLSTNIISDPEDVLWNFSEENNSFQKYSQSIAHLEIKELNTENIYTQSQTEAGSENKVTIILTHKIEECNYAHCTFEIWFNSIEVTKDNYKETLRKNSVLKTWCKNELSKMQIKGEIRLNW